MKKSETIIVELCMGSACFALGNNIMVDVLKQFVEKQHLSESVQIRGAFCEGLCGKGPVVKIDGIHYFNQSAEMLTDRLLAMTQKG